MQRLGKMPNFSYASGIIPEVAEVLGSRYLESQVKKTKCLFKFSQSLISIIMYNKLIAHISQHISLTDRERTILLSKISERHYLKGHYILQHGDICKTSNFITKGAVKAFYLDSVGKEHVMTLALENWWTGDLSSFLTQMPAAYNIQCVEPTTVIQINYEDRAELLRELPKLDKYFRIIIEKAYVATQDRIVRNFALTAKERYIHFSQTYPEHLIRFPQYMIASYLGITKEFLSKIRSQ